MKQNNQTRSKCPINFALESFGDRWTLLIVRDMLLFGKRSYSEFLDSAEGIATNILASRLAQLEQKGLLVKQPHESDKRKELYTLTEKGQDILPVLMELSRWSARHAPRKSPVQE